LGFFFQKFRGQQNSELSQLQPQLRVPVGTFLFPYLSLALSPTLGKTGKDFQWKI
jgi:hypothetical protein